jgi:RNA recognition motif-containing protein
MASKLFVGGLSYSTTSESLREYFAQCGTVESATVVTDRATGRSRGFGFVEMATEEEAQTAISRLNDKPFEGRRLTVNLSNPQAARPRTGGPGGGRGGDRSRPGGGRDSGFGGFGGFGGSRKPARW